MKAAIVTVWGLPDNYGNVLQAFALQKFLLQYGIYSEVILFSHIYTTESSKIKQVLYRIKANGVSAVKAKVFSIFRFALTARKIKKRDFAAFISKNINVRRIKYFHLDDLKNTLDYDFCIAGSDQVWSCLDDCSKDYFDVLTLKFAPKNALKISCSASFGYYENAFRNRKKEIADSLKDFDFISVREKKGLDICNNLGLKNCVLQPDPTFLLGIDFYKKFCKFESTDLFRKKYVLLYLLNNSSNFSIVKLKKWAKANDLNVIYVSGNSDVFKFSFHWKVYPKISEWLSLVSNAEFVFTNSFHGICFSIIFNKLFLGIKQIGKFAGQNSRFDSVLDLFNLRNRIFNKDLSAVKVGIDWNTVNIELGKIRRESPFVKYIDKIRENLDIKNGFDAPKISCIIPIYNSEKYLPYCIDSILAQTFTNFELILVDDGSSDGCPEICDEYAKKDDRVRVIHQSNAGVSAARNTGLDVARGEYLCFVDSDDYISQNLFSTYLFELKQKDLDLIICGFKNFYDNNKRKSFCELPNQEIYDLKDFWKNFGNLLNNHILRSPCNKLYRSDIINNHGIRFDTSTQMAEDAIFNSVYYDKINSLRVCNKPLYNVRIHNSSSRLTNSYHKNFLISQITLFKNYVNLLSKNNVLSGENIDVVSYEFSNLLWKGLADESRKKNCIPLSIIKNNIIDEIFPINKEISRTFYLFAQIIIKDDVLALKRILILRTGYRTLLYKELFQKCNAWKKRIPLYIKYVFMRALNHIEFVFKIIKIKKCTVC